MMIELKQASKEVNKSKVNKTKRNQCNHSQSSSLAQWPWTTMVLGVHRTIREVGRLEFFECNWLLKFSMEAEGFNWFHPSNDTMVCPWFVCAHWKRPSTLWFLPFFSPTMIWCFNYHFQIMILVEGKYKFWIHTRLHYSLLARWTSIYFTRAFPFDRGVSSSSVKNFFLKIYHWFSHLQLVVQQFILFIFLF